MYLKLTLALKFSGLVMYNVLEYVDKKGAFRQHKEQLDNSCHSESCFLKTLIRISKSLSACWLIHNASILNITILANNLTITLAKLATYKWKQRQQARFLALTIFLLLLLLINKLCRNMIRKVHRKIYPNSHLNISQ